MNATKNREEWSAWLRKEFEWFHAHPELSNEEFETTRRLRGNLEEAGIPVLDLGLETGLVAQIGTGDAPHIALRADIDALPVTEQTDLPYQSAAPGKMHACGHDFHLSAVLGAAVLLKEQEQSIGGTISIVFQPAEEVAGGAKKILDTGALSEVQLIFGLHSSSSLAVGEIGIREGAVTASVDRFAITFRGKGAHAAQPDRGINPILMVAEFISAVPSIRSHNLDPFAPNLVSVTHVEGGNTWNVTPETAWLEGTVRSLSPKDRAKIKERIYCLAEGIAAAFGGSADIQWYAGPPPTNNDKEWAAFAKEKALARDLVVRLSPPSMIGEDFACYQEAVPGVFLLVGTGLSSALHSPTFQVDPRALPPTAEYLAGLCRGALARLASDFEGIGYQ